MRLRFSTGVAAVWVSVVLCACACPAQQLIGYVPKRDATVTCSTDELDGQAVLMGSASITAKEDHTAPVKLTRGGTVRVCQTSQLKITESRQVAVAAPLLFSLDRGAIEIETNANSSDQIMTPDLRFTIRNSGPLDLRMRVARNGDTCVENRGAEAPTLAVSDAFGESMYELPAGQHVLFEHGSVREVVDHETIPCGCPEKGVSMADAMVAPGTAKASKANEPNNPAAAQHPFPLAQSAGLTPDQPAGSAEPSPQPAPGAAQINDALSYTGGLKDPDELDHAQPAKPTAVTAPTAPPAQTASVGANGNLSGVAAPTAPPTPQPAAKPDQPPVNDVVHIVGRLFRKMFRR